MLLTKSWLKKQKRYDSFWYFTKLEFFRKWPNKWLIKLNIIILKTINNLGIKVLEILINVTTWANDY